MILLAPLHAGASSDESGHFIVVPGACVSYWIATGDLETDAEWGAVLSFAACIQDTSTPTISRADELPALVEELRNGLVPAAGILVAAFERGPGPIKIRAAYALGMAELALITRARLAIPMPHDYATDPRAAATYRELHELLEPLLELYAMRAHVLFEAIDRATAMEPSLAPDEVVRGIVRSARTQAALLRNAWSIPEEDQPRRLQRTNHRANRSGQ